MNIRLLAVPVLSLSLLALPSASAETTTPTGATVQTYNGSFLAPTRFTDTQGGWPGLGRKVYLAAQAADGIIADVFPVDARAAGGSFVLGNVKDLTGQGNLDVYFYADLASAADGTPETTGQFATADKGEKGFVPAGTRYAVVFSPDAVQPTFTFTATERPVVDLTALDGVTVPAGTTLGVRNDTGDYADFKHVTPAKPLVDRSGTGRGLLAGEVVNVVLTKVGSQVFESSAGTATVTVTS